jgi:hypothetical protein
MATFTAPFTNADVASAIPEIWGNMVNQPNFPKAVLSNFFVDLSDLVSAGGDIVHVPDIYTNELTVGTQSTQGAQVTDSSPASVDTTLTLDVHKYVAFVIGDQTMAQLAESLDLHAKYALEAQNLLIQELEDEIAGLYASAATSVGTTATSITDAALRQAIRDLDAANFDMTETAFFLHPNTYWGQVAAISKFTANESGALSSFVREGNFGPADASRGLRGVIYGQPIYVTSRIVDSGADRENLFAHPSAIGWAAQTRGESNMRIAEGGSSQNMGESRNMIRVQADNLVQNIATITVADIIFGADVLRSTGFVRVIADDDNVD